MTRQPFIFFEYPADEPAAMHALEPFADREEHAWEGVMEKHRGIWAVEGRIRLAIRFAFHHAPLASTDELLEIADRSMRPLVLNPYGSLNGLLQRVDTFVKDSGKDVKTARQLFVATNTLTHIANKPDALRIERELVLGRIDRVAKDITRLLATPKGGTILDATKTVLLRGLECHEAVKEVGEQRIGKAAQWNKRSRGRQGRRYAADRNSGDTN